MSVSRTKVGPSGDAYDWDEATLGLSRPMHIRVLLMQVLSTVALFIMFWSNWTMNPYSFELRSFSSIFGPLAPEVIGIIGLFAGALLSGVPSFWHKVTLNWEKVLGFKYTRLRALVILIIIIVIIVAWLGPVVFLGIVIQLFIAFFFIASMLFGVYGIWRMKGTHIVTSAMFAFFTAVSTPKTWTDPWIIMVFAVSFLLFVEVSASTVRLYLLASEEFVPVRFQTRMVDRYLINLGLFSVLAAGLTFLALRARLLLNFVSPAWAVESLELQGLVGLVVPAIGTLVAVALIRYLWDYRFMSTFKGIKERKVFEGKSPRAIARALLRTEG